MKIRIGNDIRLDVTLSYKSSGDGTVDVTSAQAYIINTTKEQEYIKALENKTRFISRFPVEPYINAYSSTAYDIKSCGYPMWNAYPKNYVYATYSGFGPNPDWEHKYRNMPKYNHTQYKAEVKYTQDRSVIEVYFPAIAQFYTGKYTLVIVAQIYQPGYGHNNLKTVTMDYPEVFELVSSSEQGIDDSVTINVVPNPGSNPDEPQPEPIDIHVDSGVYIEDPTNGGRLELNLNNEQQVNISLSSATGWYEGD